MSLYSSRRVFIRFLLKTLPLAAVVPATFLAATETDQKESKKEEDSKSSAGDPVYEPGGDVRPPKLTHYVEPAFSSSSKEAFVEGTVKISTVVNMEGQPTRLQVLSGLNSEEDRTAIDAVTKWRFQPGTKDGRPVNVKVTVEVDFHLL